VLDVLAERETIYRLLPQTTHDNLSKDFKGYTVDPTTRYPNLVTGTVQPAQIAFLFDSDYAEEGGSAAEREPHHPMTAKIQECRHQQPSTVTVQTEKCPVPTVDKPSKVIRRTGDVTGDGNEHGPYNYLIFLKLLDSQRSFFWFNGAFR